MSENNSNEFISQVAQKEYEYGFTTDVHTETIQKGLSEDVIRLISAKKEEPEWLLEFRLKAYRHWLTMPMPDWALLNIPEIDDMFSQSIVASLYACCPSGVPMS